MHHTRTLQITILTILTLILDASTRIYAQLQRTPITALYPQHQDLCIIDSTAYTWYESHGRRPYRAIYFDKKKVQYYSVTNIQETNNIFFSYNPTKAVRFFKPEDIKYEPSLLYVGNVSQLERVYVDTNDNKQYIKTLIPLQFEVYDARDPKNPHGASIQNQKLKDNKLYPALEKRSLIFTNKSGIIFIMSIAGTIGEKEPVWTPEELKNYNPDNDIKDPLPD